MTNDSRLWDRSRTAALAEVEATALRLFLSQGFDETTVDHIVAEAGVSRRSFFRYFGTKEDVLLGKLVRQGPDLLAALEARPDSEGPWDALYAALSAMRGLGATPREELAISKMLHETPSLRARSAEKHAGWRELLAPEMRRRMGIPADNLVDPRPDALIACTLACVDVAGESWVRSGGTADLTALMHEAVAGVRDALDDGRAGIGER